MFSVIEPPATWRGEEFAFRRGSVSQTAKSVFETYGFTFLVRPTS